ncbi:hypothetical protein [Chryseobacterium daeguense]|uniref:hypothetical protein n=1 Tax=Chryseobacterium daeguense TaxID=412438 RepID=UPI00041D2F68|nr:hypothetical protein [Chryseobacterium daeguense]
MRHLKRLDKPQILEEKHIWTEKFIESGKKRPSSKQYDHEKIKEELAKISLNKCFYTEVLFSDLSEAQVDHYIEVAEDKNKTFEWENLYLAHEKSNVGKSSNKAIPNLETLDPFIDYDDEIEKHIFFVDNNVRGLTEKGIKTIQKYNLNKGIFNGLRATELIKFYKVWVAIGENKSNRDFTDLEKQTLKSFAQPDAPFSLMFRLILKQHSLL